MTNETAKSQERLVSLGITGAQLKVPLIPLNPIVAVDQDTS